ncbi:MAG: hypothetical protein ACK5QT_10400 [Oligoflexia bacterium]|jgi:hypothetical protein
MAADRSGQSLLEFVLVLPVMAGMFMLMLRLNSSIQTSIVNQRYSRQRIFEFADNAPYYPRLSTFRDQFVSKNTNRMVIGVSEEPLSGDSVEPDAPVTRISTSRTFLGSNEPRAEPNRRSEVRVRNTVEICTPVRVSGGREIDWGENSLNGLSVCTGGSS